MSVLSSMWARVRSPPEPPAPEPPGPDAQLDGVIRGEMSAAVSIEGDFRVSGKLELRDGLVVNGSVHIAEGSELRARTEVHGDVFVGEHAKVLGPLLVHGNLTLGKQASVPSCHVDGDVTLDEGACVEGNLHCRTLYVGASATGETSPVAFVAVERT